MGNAKINHHPSLRTCIFSIWRFHKRQTKGYSQWVSGFTKGKQKFRAEETFISYWRNKSFSI